MLPFIMDQFSHIKNSHLVCDVDNLCPVVKCQSRRMEKLGLFADTVKVAFSTTGQRTHFTYRSNEVDVSVDVALMFNMSYPFIFISVVSKATTVFYINDRCE